MAAIWSGATSTYADAFRYDPWGETIDHSRTSSARSAWRRQGPLVEAEASDTGLYDFGFRSYVEAYSRALGLDVFDPAVYGPRLTLIESHGAGPHPDASDFEVAC